MNTQNFFKKQAAIYAQARPNYPQSLYDFLNTLIPEHNHVIDCATGSGQAAQQLARQFEQVLAFDISQEQLDHAPAAPNIQYKQASASHIPAPDKSADLITVATGVHWFNLPEFYEEVRRVAKNHGVLAVWCYGASTIDDENITAIAREVAGDDVLGPFWSKANLDYVATNYASLPFDFEEIACPTFEIKLNVPMDRYLGYLRSWSAAQRYVDHHGKDPIEMYRSTFEAQWGDPQSLRTWTTPVFMRAGRIHPT